MDAKQAFESRRSVACHERGNEEKYTGQRVADERASRLGLGMDLPGSTRKNPN